MDREVIPPPLHLVGRLRDTHGAYILYNQSFCTASIFYSVNTDITIHAIESPMGNIYVLYVL